MTTLDELQRSVERLSDVEAVLRQGQGGITRDTDYAKRVSSDLHLLLSERAKLLDTVERLRERVMDAVKAWVREDCSTGLKMMLTPKCFCDLETRILDLIQSERGSSSNNDDVQLLLSERAELLDTVARLRHELVTAGMHIEISPGPCEDRAKRIVQNIRAVLTTGEGK